MEKYGTYKVYKNITTGEILRIAFNPETEEMSDDFQKIAEDLSQWQELTEDPEDKK